MDTQKNENASLFVGGLKPAVKRTDIVAHFSKYGDVKNVNMGKLPTGLNNRGFTFIKFCKSTSVELVLAEKQLIMGREVECRLSYGKKYNQVDMEVNSKRKLYVSELSTSDKNEDLQNYFSKFGKIEQAYIIYYPNTTISKCFGYVEFKKENNATKAMNVKHKSWKVSNFKSYKNLKDSKQELSDTKQELSESNTRHNTSKSDVDSTGSLSNLSKNVTAQQKGALYSKIVEEQQNSYTKENYQTDLQESSNFSQEENNCYQNNYQIPCYEDQQQIDYYNQDYSQYYNYQQVEPTYSYQQVEPTYSYQQVEPTYNYQQYPDQYNNTQNLPYDYNTENNYYNGAYYQQDGQVVSNNYQNFDCYNTNPTNFDNGVDQNVANWYNVQNTN